MNIACIGGGPASLYFSILMKKRFPEVSISVFERNKPDDTFGWGVVFSKETLGKFADADAESYSAICSEFTYWDDIDIWLGGTKTTSTGHGFCGLSRQRLLQLLHRRCRELNVAIQFERDVAANALPTADLVIAADGVHSAIRTAYAEHFQPDIDWRRCKFTWMGTTLPLKAFTFYFKQTKWGVFQVHAYPFEANRSTWIVECREEVWRAAGLDTLSEEESAQFLQKLFETELQGHPLLINKSVWRTFPNIRCGRWVKDNIVLLGDAAHTAHFSIGSGTKLAMEDSIALVDAFARMGTGDIPAVLMNYENVRRKEVDRIQRAAQTSLEWFENSARYLKLHPTTFAFHLMTRSKRITHANLKLRDPALVDAVDTLVATTSHATFNSDSTPPPPAMTPFALRGLALANRLVVSPMCQYSAVDGNPTDWHLVHLGSRAVGGAGCVIAEMTDVSAIGRITPGCTGLYDDSHVASWKRIVDFIHQNSAAKVGIQLGHAGRKASCRRPWEGEAPLEVAQGGWQAIAPSPLPFDAHWPAPREMVREDFQTVLSQYISATRRAQAAGFDLIELHCAHGYLLSSFLSPVSNQRRDEYGGSLENRLRFPLEVFDAIRAVWPSQSPLFVRISASDWLGSAGLTVEDAVVIARAFKSHGCDLVDVSSAGNSPKSRPAYGAMYQVPFAEAVRYEAEIPVMAVGALFNVDNANTIVGSERADLCAIARGFLSDPYLSARYAQEQLLDQVAWPNQYRAVKPVRNARKT